MFKKMEKPEIIVLDDDAPFDNSEYMALNASTSFKKLGIPRRLIYRFLLYLKCYEYKGVRYFKMEDINKVIEWKKSLAPFYELNHIFETNTSNMLHFFKREGFSYIHKDFQPFFNSYAFYSKDLGDIKKAFLKEAPEDIFDKEKYITLGEARNILECELGPRQRKFFEFYVIFKHIPYLKREEVQYYQELKAKTIRLQDLAEKIENEGLSTVRTVGKFVKKLEIETIEWHPFYMQAKLIYRKDADKVFNWFKEDAEIKRLQKLGDGNKLYELYIKNIPIKKEIQKTLECFDSFVVKRFEKIESKANNSIVAYNLAGIYKLLIEILDKEFFEYDQDSIDEIMGQITGNEEYSQFSRNEFKNFYNYMIETMKIKELQVFEGSKNDFYVTTRKRDAYSQEQFLNLFALIHNAVNDRNYIIAAINDRVISQLWLYMYLHYITIWRLGDLQKLPSPYLDLIGFNDGQSFLDWLSDEKNIFTEQMGISICESVKSQIDTFNKKISKTRKKQSLVFEVGRFTARVAGLLLAICEAHRQIIEKRGAKNTNYTCMLTNTVGRCKKYSSLFNGKVSEILGDYGFQNRMLNKSYNNYIHNYSEENNDMYATHVLSVMRGYVIRTPEFVSPTTSIYETRTTDGTISSITSTLFERGSFAFAKLNLLTIADKSIAECSSDEKTDLITNLKMSPAEAEAAVKTIYQQSEVVTDLIIKMETQPKEVKQILGELAFGNTQGKHLHTKCLLKAILNTKIENINNTPVTKLISTIEMLKDYKNSSNCLLPETDTCFGCSMLVGEMYFLYEINKRIFDSINKLKSCNNEYECYMHSNLIYKTYMPLVREANAVLGKETVNLFMEGDKIIDEIKMLDEANKVILQLKEGK